MTDFLTGIRENEIIIAAFFAFLSAQIIKTLLYTVIHRDFNPERLLGDGGMPSSHSATVMAMTTATLMTRGVRSAEFAIALIMATVVMHDAVGVRRETGIQARVINEMMDLITKMTESMPAEERLKELIGHSPLQVLMGAVLGVLIGMLVCVRAGV